MKKQVPEGNKKSISPEKQLDILRKHLMGNHAFAICRGQFGKQIITVTNEMLDQTQSPNALLNQWDEFCGKTRVMANLLAQFKRKGLEIALDELTRALTIEGYAIPGETIPFELTQPITILMLDPERTMLMARWIIKDNWVELNNYLDWKKGLITDFAFGVESLAEQLFEMFPTLEEHTRVRRTQTDHVGLDLCRAYNDSVLFTFSEGVRHILKTAQKRRLEDNQFHEHIRIGNYPFLYVFQCEQSAVLSMFSREEQKRIATWQINAPKVLGECYDVGVYPEDMHGQLHFAHPCLASKGVSHGLGAMIVIENQFRTCLITQYPRFKSSTQYSGIFHSVLFEN